MKWFLCLQREDSDKIGLLAYFPPNGTFNLMYYPYYGKKAQVRLGFKSQNNKQKTLIPVFKYGVGSGFCR